MTFEELHNYVSKQLGSVMQNEDDWRPAGDMYIEDIVHVIDTKHCTIPNGIRIWLNSGDSIIYVKAPKGRRNGMVDREKVIKALECCHQINQTECFKCPYARGNGCRYLMDDVLTLLKSQEPRVMTLEEVKTADVVFMEFQDVITTRIVDTWFGNGDGDIRLAGIDGTRYMAKDAYNDSWRCWTSRPTDEQREAELWNS